MNEEMRNKEVKMPDQDNIQEDLASGKQEKDNRKWLMIGVICGILALILLLLFLLPRCSREEAPKNDKKEANDYTSPIDWESLWEKNKDIYAWIEIPVTDEAVKAGSVITTTDSVTGKGKAFISAPVVQNAQDDERYMDRNAYGEYDGYGAVFTEHEYNKNDFSDVMTMIYGHRNEYNFGTLQAQYSSEAGFKACQTIMIYLPDREIKFIVWAAVPHNSSHILYYNDFTSKADYAGFVKRIKGITSLSARFDKEVKMEIGDQLVGLSTCLMGNRQNRFIVLGVCHKEKTNEK